MRNPFETSLSAQAKRGLLLKCNADPIIFEDVLRAPCLPRAQIKNDPNSTLVQSPPTEAHLQTHNRKYAAGCSHYLAEVYAWSLGQTQSHLSQG
jgi:hypothetical protein